MSMKDQHAVVSKVNGVLGVRVGNTTATFPRNCYRFPNRAMHAWLEYNGVSSVEYLESATGPAQ